MSIVNNNIRPFGLKDKIGYFFGDFGCNMSFSFISTYMMLYYINVMGISPVHFGIIILFTKIWDGINDPLIGSVIDSCKTGKNGKFKPWILYASFPIAIAGAFLFAHVPNVSYTLKIAMCIVTYLIWDIAYTCINVPYGSLASVMTSDPVQRAELSKYRSLGGIVGYLPLTILLPLFIFDKKNNPIGERFFFVSLALGAIAFISFMILYKFTEERILHTPDEKVKFSYVKTLGSFLKNRPMMAISFATIAQILFISSSMQVTTYVFKEYFKNTALLSLNSLIAFMPMIIAMLFINPLVKRFGKKEISTYGLIVALVLHTAMFILPMTSPYVWMAFKAVIGIFGSAFSMLIWAMVSDCIDYQEVQSGRREEASIYATYSLVRKISQGIGGSLVAFGLGFIGYNAKLPVQPEHIGYSLKQLAIGMPLLGTLFTVLAMMLMYNLDKKALVVMNEKLGRDTSKQKIAMGGHDD